VLTSRTGNYRRLLPGGLVVASTQVAHATQLEALQLDVFPSLADGERFKDAHYRKHVELFPEGQFVVLDADRLVGATSTIRRNFDFAHPSHTFAEITQGGWLTSHEPTGDWLYGADLGIHPDYRGRGLAEALYAARQELVWRLGLRGQITGAMMSGFGARKHELSAAEYYEGLRNGEINDPTISMQRRIGFEIRALLPNHLHDPLCDNYCVLIVLDAAKAVAGAVRPNAEE
jgi:GNAT superfamily N-acetyltransferase